MGGLIKASELLSLLGDMLPINNELPLSMNELKDASSCPTCGASRWKVNRRGTKKSKGVPAKVMWYFPPIPRFKRMFQSSKIAKDLIWHAQGGNLMEKCVIHPTRHHGRYSCWPVVMITYLPPWLCMKRKFMMLSLLISGPQQPGNDIDIYLAPLIEDLKTLWETGVEAYDAYQREVFTLRAVLLWTINDFPAYGNLSGCTVKGYFACPICGSETYSHRKTKDGLNSRLDLMDMGLRCELAPRNLVSMEDLKLYGLKSHDYHTLMQQLLPVALRSLLPKHVRHAIARLSLFFNALCKKVVDVSTLDKLQNELVVTLCLLEKYFPPSFFDIMIHLTVHLVREVRLCGPVYFRWMYPFERFMKVLKGYVRNRNHPEGCIVECYIAEEAIEFCTEYLSNVDAIGVPSSTNVDHKVGAPIPGEHMKWLKLNNPRQSKRQKWLQEEHMRTFTHWLRKKVEVAIADKEPISETLRWMAHGPTHYVAKYHGYVINGCQYNTKDRDELRVTQNSGVSIVATTMQISSAKDKNPVFGELCFYGIITEIWDLDYTMFRIPVFKCNWVDNKSGIKVDEFGLTLVDFTKMAHKSDPFHFSLPSQATKDSDDFMDNSIEHHPLITTLAQVESFDTMDDSDVICIRGDCEGFWIDNKSSMHGFKGRENPSQKKYRGTTRKSMIIRNRNRGIKLVIKYNADGIYVGESSVHLTSYLGVLARTMVPIRYNTWRDVPEQLKDKLWDSIEIAFTLDKKSRRNCMLTLGKCFRSFKNTLTVKHILPFKDEPELLKKPPAEYHFIDDEDWNIFVKNRLSENSSTKQRRKKHIYNHHLSRKGYAGLEEEMDELMKESQESGISYSGSNDILSQALGTPEYTGRFELKGSTTHLDAISIIGVATPQSDVSSSNMKSKLLLLPEVVENQFVKLRRRPYL
ncbi:hypothetical protein CK203_090862 [Vitis vinifera]|uniref:DUF4218 domain-containing protein n=1 Tax=Vitis vinifera TaxID=29760 RepID=A0A438CMX1_VITVI|nr:hypothetical protein CK203_090862 [Vitis vinifera]